MKLITQVKLVPSKQQEELLKATLETANCAANRISGIAWEHRVFGKYALHKLVYHRIREEFPLSAQMVVRLVSKVADSYRLTKKSKHEFRKMGAITYDHRILTWKINSGTVSLWTMDGRSDIKFVCGERNLKMLAKRQGEADMLFRGGDFYILQTCNIDEIVGDEVCGYLGVDMGVTNVAVDSDGVVHHVEELKKIRKKYGTMRKTLQSIGTKSAKKKLRRLAGRESRFVTWVNHNISKKIVVKAKDTERGISIENLKGIRNRTTVNKRHNEMLHNWAFFQLRQFITYKAKLLGVPVVVVDPYNTSITCPTCSFVSKLNRKSQAEFVCEVCGVMGFADHVAAINISKRAEIIRPIVSVGVK